MNRTRWRAPVALRDRNLRVFASAQLVYQTGGQIAPIALAFAVLALSDSATDLGIALAARTIPALLFVLLGGVLADRLPRKQLLVASDWGNFVAQSALALFLLAGHATLIVIVFTQALAGLCSAAYHPASRGIVPLIATRSQLQHANALVGVVGSATSILGPLVGGLLVASVGPGWAIGADAITYAISAILISQIKVERGPAVRARVGFLPEFLEGWRTVQRTRWLRLVIAGDAVFQLVVIAPLFVLGPRIAADTYGGAASWGAMIASYAVGSLVGATVALYWKPRRPLLVGAAATLPLPIAFSLLGLGSDFPLVAVALLASGIGVAVSDIVWHTAVQGAVPEQRLARVVSIDWFGSTLLRPVGYLAAGLLSTILGTPPAFFIAVLLQIGMFAILLSSQEIRSRQSNE